MKKRKINILLNIATLCLCVCAIAFGVYSAKQASLNVSGTIGFSAHNVKATVSAQIKGDAVNGTTASADGTPRADYETIGSEVTITGTESTTPSLALSKFYFSDMGESGTPEDIYLKISVTNNSAFNIKAYFDAPSIDGVTISLGDGSSSYVKLGTTDTTKSGDIVLKLSLNANSSGDYDNLTTENNINLTMHLDKYEDYYVKSITENVYTGSAFEDVTTNRLCTQLGHGTKEDLNGAEFELLEWYAFAVKGESLGNDNYIYNNEWNNADAPQSERWYSLYGVDMTNVDYKGKTFWFIQEYVVAGGYYINDTDSSTQKGIQFNPGSGNLNNTYAQVNNSKKSTIYTFLENDYATKTGISTEELNKIDSRSVNENYEVKFSGYNTTTTDSKNYLACQFSSKFWLINHAELGLLCNQSVGMSDSGNKVKTYGISNQDGKTLSSGTVYAAAWWLRSPDANNYSNAHYVTDSGSFSNQFAFFSLVGVRAAFQITL